MVYLSNKPCFSCTQCLYINVFISMIFLLTVMAFDSLVQALPPSNIRSTHLQDMFGFAQGLATNAIYGNGPYYGKECLWANPSIGYQSTSVTKICENGSTAIMQQLGSLSTSLRYCHMYSVESSKQMTEYCSLWRSTRKSQKLRLLFAIAGRSRICLGDSLQPSNQQISQFNSDHLTNTTVAVPRTMRCRLPRERT
jgi:hypothetical protein